MSSGLNTFRSRVSLIHLKLNGLTRTTLPSDIRRMLAKYNITENVRDIQLDYKRFIPTGSAYLTFTTQTNLHRALIELRNASHLGSQSPPPERLGPQDLLPVRAGTEVVWKHHSVASSLETVTARASRRRGRAWSCGVCQGNDYGYHARVLAGLQVGTREGQVTKLDALGTQLTSRHFVRLNSVSEAYRLVRNVHMTFFEPLVWGDRYIIRARVVH